MKKFMQSKFRKNELNKGKPALNALTLSVTLQEEIILEEIPNIFPPLPLESPPPGNPLIIKQDAIEQEYKQETELFMSLQEELPKVVSATKPEPTLNAPTPVVSLKEEFIPEVEYIQEEVIIPEVNPKIFSPLAIEPPLPRNPPLLLEPSPPGNPPIIKQDVIEQEYKQETEPFMPVQKELPTVVSVTKPEPTLNALTPVVSSNEEFIPEVEFIQEEVIIPKEKPKIFSPLTLEPTLTVNPPLPLEPPPPGNPPIIKQDIIEQEYKQETEPVMSFQQKVPKVVSATKPEPILNSLMPVVSLEEEIIREVEFIQEGVTIPEGKPKIFPPLTLEPPLPGNPTTIHQDIIEQEPKHETEPVMSFQKELPKVISATPPGSTPIICKEYMLRRDCKRRYCKQTHIDNLTEEEMRTGIRFCHDFQNKKCFNPNCRYIHGTKEEEKFFFIIRTQHSSSKQENTEKAVPATYIEQPLVPTVPPPKLEDKPIICRTFHLHGSCRRSSCKHLHVDHPTMEQVRSAFVFCQNFQRTECWVPNCTLLHANTVEEMYFYRTRELPLSCLLKVSSIIKQDNIRDYKKDTKMRKALAPSFQETLPKLVPPPIAEPKKVLCRLYHLCGTCGRGSSCQYLHVDIPTDSQVRNAFLFCYNFQFKICNDTYNCKDIHATMAEELFFYKTRKLPPNVSSSIIRQEMISKYKGDATLKPKGMSIVCKSYLRGLCRKQNCKYRHENNPTLVNLQDAFSFCHNFQNLIKCPFENCSYIHATTLEEMHFYETKKLPPHVFSHIPFKEMIFGPAFLYPERIKHNEKMAAFEEANKKIAFVLHNLFEPASKAWGKDVDQEVAALLAKWDQEVTIS